jgi:hypothetical protein
MAKKATKAEKEPKKATLLVDDLVELNEVKSKKSKKKSAGEDDVDSLDEVVIDPDVHEMEEDESTYEMGKIQVADADTDEEKVDLAKIPTDTLDGEEDDLTEAADEGTITIDEDPYLDAENFDGDNPDEEYYN